MARLGNMSAKVIEAEMEEGEIVDELDYLSDISSEEEFLLRQRLQVLENYNNVLERKKAKRSLGPGTKHKKTHIVKEAEVTPNDLANNYYFPKNLKIQIKTNVPRAYRHLKPHHKIKRKKELHVEDHSRIRELKKKPYKTRKRVSESSESSDETGSEYRDKRRKLANAVIVNKTNGDKTSLSARLRKMLGSSIPESKPVVSAIKERKQTDTENIKKSSCENKNNDIDPIFSPISSTNAEDSLHSAENEDKIPDLVDAPSKRLELIDLCSDDENAIDHNDNLNTIVCPHIENVTCNDNNNDINGDEFDIEKINGKRKSVSEKDSDDDLELLRQNALQTKTVKAKTPIENENKVGSDDEDSDTAELRLICLKSALLKKAIEMKQKQKMQKRLSQSSNLQDDFLNEHDLISNKITSENNTDIESVDMDIVSDGDDKFKDTTKVGKNNNIEETANTEGSENSIEKCSKAMTQEDDFEEDEDLLRAKLLTSLSKNLPNLVDTSILDALPHFKPEITASKPKIDVKNIPEEKRFIIKLGDSDSEGEHEATKNLTKMHMKLSENLEFQQKLDMFLKTTRMQVENTTQPDVTQEPITPKKTEKFVAKAVKHLPKPEQIEYKNLVKRMAELEKIKQSRQVIIHIHKTVPPIETLKPRNVSDSQKPMSIDFIEQIAMSRKKIAEESAKMLKLKEEATKLSQKYKIAATELRNITTAITLNKRQQKIVQNGLHKIRLQHQTLLRSNPIKKHSQGNGHMTSLNHVNNKINPPVKLQKENDPRKEEHKTQHTVRSVKLSTVDRKDEIHPADPRLSIQVTVPKSPGKEKVVDKNTIRDHSDAEKVVDKNVHSTNDIRNEASHPIVEKGGGHQNKAVCDHSYRRRKSIDDYESPLQSLRMSHMDGRLRTHRRAALRFGEPIPTRSSVHLRSAANARTPNANTYTQKSPLNDTTRTHARTNTDIISHVNKPKHIQEDSFPFPYPSSDD